MKKIFNFIILLVVCFIPVMVNAKANIEYEDVYINNGYVTSKDGLNYFYDFDKMIYEEDFILVYNNEGELVKKISLLRMMNILILK